MHVYCVLFLDDIFKLIYTVLRAQLAKAEVRCRHIPVVCCLQSAAAAHQWSCEPVKHESNTSNQLSVLTPAKSVSTGHDNMGKETMQSLITDLLVGNPLLLSVVTEVNLRWL